MSTMMKHHTSWMVSPPATKPRNDKQLRRDRWTAVIVAAVMVVLTALVIWLASLGGSDEYDGGEYWHMMP